MFKVLYHILSLFHFHCLDSHLATSRLMPTSAIQVVHKTPGDVVILELVMVLAGDLFILFLIFSSHFIHSSYVFLCLSSCVGKTSSKRVFTVICVESFNLKSHTITSVRHTPGAISNNGHMRAPVQRAQA